MAADALLLPGLGADRRLFQAQALALDVLTPDWPRLQPQDSLPEFARRLASTLSEPLPRVIGGASFGGMVALELAVILRPKAVLLIGSCTGPDAVAPPLRLLGRLARVLPERLFRPSRWAAPVLLPLFQPGGVEQRRLFWDMASGVAPAFLSWGCRAILDWRPTRHNLPVHHLHGSKDRLIPLARVRPTEVVGGAGHLLSLSHPQATTAFLTRVMASLT